MNRHHEAGATAPAWRTRVEASFAAQGLLALLRAELVHLAPGEADVAVPFREEVSQHHGFFHGGLITTLLDVACGMAALSGMAPNREVLSAEFKVNFLAPATGKRLVARGRVVQAGRRLVVCTGSAFADDGRHVALMQATMAAAAPR